jgi:hypothetical protein
VHDWDSLAWQPEAALAGAASAVFAAMPGRTSWRRSRSSQAFLAAYQDSRGRLFTAAEQEIAWAAGLWMTAYQRCTDFGLETPPVRHGSSHPN